MILRSQNFEISALLGGPAGIIMRGLKIPLLRSAGTISECIIYCPANRAGLLKDGGFMQKLPVLAE
jgi:hypothetical protein